MTFKSVIKPFKNIWQLIGGMVLVNTFFLLFFWKGAFNDLTSFGIATIWGTTIWIVMSVGNSFIFHYLDEVYPWTKGLGKRALLTTLAVGIYSASAYLIIQIIMFSLFYSHVSFSEVVATTFNSTWITVAIAFAISFVLTFFGFAKALVRNEVEKERLQTEMMRYKYESLRNQINPHFLFNSFNVLSELVYEDQGLAVKFIRQLSDLYRYVLDSKDKELVALSDELKFIESFTFLLKTRFENRVEFKIDITPNEDEFIIPMALQLLIENCIKHNQSSTQKPLQISVSRKGETIEVSNSLQRKIHPEESFRIGLKNLKERYAYFNNKEIQVNETETEYKVCIPILKLES
jgi:sensor histidine kinase YesM